MATVLTEITREGAKYGLELNWSKTFQMNICTNVELYCPDGTKLVVKKDLMYLGGLISCDSRSEGALNKKLSEGRAIFKVLCRVWSHAGISRYRKLQIFNACVASKFLYSLESLWLLQKDKRRVNSFQCSCLRRIAKIQPSFISRVSNDEVFNLTKQEKISATLEKRQIRLYQKIQALPLATPIRCPKNLGTS